MSRRRIRVVVAGLFTVVMLAGTATAWAQDDNSPPPESPPPAFVAPPPGYEPPQQYAAAGAAQEPVAEDLPPTFITLDRMDAYTRLGLQVAFVKVDAINLSDEFFMRFNPYAQYVFPGKTAGIYGQLPISHAFNLNGGDETGYGNLEMGGFLMPMHSNELILRAGLAVATSSDEDNFGGVFANAATLYERLTDFVLVAPHYTSARLSASTVQQIGDVFIRADGGFDIVLDRQSTSSSQPSVFFRANIAGGFRLPGVDLTAELVNVAAVNGTVTGGITDRFIHTAAIGVRTTGENQLHLGMVFPLDEDSRGDFWIVSFGYQRAIY
jgi:hypothetical protein